MFLYWFKIHSKPRGNFRPLVEMKLEIKAADYPHRPYIPNLRIHENIANDCKYIKNSPFLPIFQKLKEEENNVRFYANSRKDVDTCYSSCDDCSCVTLFNKMFLDEDVHNYISFYLPWKEGINPDYSNYYNAFLKIPAILEELLKQGSDSGESKELEYTYSPLVVAQKEAKKDVIRIVG